MAELYLDVVDCRDVLLVGDRGGELARADGALGKEESGDRVVKVGLLVNTLFLEKRNRLIPVSLIVSSVTKGICSADVVTAQL